MLKRLLSVFVVCGILLSTLSLMANATVVDSQGCECLVYANQFISRISQSLPLFFDWKSAEPGNGQYLYDATGKMTVAMIFDVSCDGIDKGYVIVDYSSYEIIEFSKSASPYGELLDHYISEKKIASIQDKYYIYSPGTHAVAIKSLISNQYSVYDFTKDTSVSIDLHSKNNSTISNPIKASVLPIIVENAIKTKGVIPLATGVHYKILTGVPDASYTISCIPTAIGNVIGYWDTHGYPNLISSSKTIYNAISEVNGNLIAACGNNTSNSAIPAATQAYCRASGRYPNNFTVTNMWNPSYSSFKSQISSGNPALVGFASGNSYYGGAHMTAGMGYYYDDAFPNEKYIYVHDAWSTTAADYMVLWSSYNDFMAKIVP